MRLKGVVMIIQYSLFFSERK